jgi:PAS domain S-box-containing protein
MIDRQLIHSRGVRVVLALAVWGGMASFGLWQYRSASIATTAQLARESEARATAEKAQALAEKARVLAVKARELEATRSEGLEAIMADDHYGVITVDRDGRVIDWNPGVENLSRVSEAEALGQNIADLVCGELTAKLERSFQEREAGDGKVLVENCDMIGSAVKVRCRIYSARSKKTGDILGVVLVDPQANVTGESLTSQPRG